MYVEFEYLIQLMVGSKGHVLKTCGPLIFGKIGTMCYTSKKRATSPSPSSISLDDDPSMKQNVATAKKLVTVAVAQEMQPPCDIAEKAVTTCLKVLPNDNVRFKRLPEGRQKAHPVYYVGRVMCAAGESQWKVGGMRRHGSISLNQFVFTDGDVSVYAEDYIFKMLSKNPKQVRSVLHFPDDLTEFALMI
jgi:hypothetical protein